MRNKPLKGMLKASPLKNPTPATRPLTSGEKEKLKGYTGSGPSSGKAAVQIGKKAWDVSSDIVETTITSKKKEAKTGFTTRKL